MTSEACMRAAIVATARTWLGTPWAHQARLRGIGVDCIGLVGEVGCAAGALAPELWREVSERWSGYSRRPSGGALRETCAKHLVEVEVWDAQPGDVLLMHFGAEPQHLAIVSAADRGSLSIIHAYMRARRVVEHRVDATWAARIVAAYALPGVRA